MPLEKCPAKNEIEKLKTFYVKDRRVEEGDNMTEKQYESLLNERSEDHHREQQKSDHSKEQENTDIEGELLRRGHCKRS